MGRRNIAPAMAARFAVLMPRIRFLRFNLECRCRWGRRCHRCRAYRREKEPWRGFVWFSLPTDFPLLSCGECFV